MLTRLQTLFKRSLFLYFIVFIHTASIPAKIIDVPTTSNPSIQSGIDAAQDGDTVLVQPGSYKEQINFSGKNLTVSSLYLINKNRQYIRQTILDGDQKDRVVIINKNEDSSAVLCGFTITNANTPYSGGGVYCANSQPCLKSLIITENNAYRGGALHCYGANPILDDVKIYNNRAENVGGGICMINSNPSLYSVSIFKNLAKFNGGGISAENSKPNFDETNLCNIYGNIAFFAGEDIYTDSLIDVTIDTFTVLEPTYIHISPLKLINLSLQNSYLTQVHADLYVSPSGSNENDGLSENDPLRTIGHAMRIIQSDSLNPRKVYVAAGVYSSETNGEYFPVKCVNYVSIIGNIENSQNSDGVVNSVVDANRQNHVIHISNLKDIQLRNLIIQNSGESWKAGGIYCFDSNLEIDNLLIHNNISDDKGGGIYVQNSTILISNSQISENFAKTGGGIYCRGSDIFMRNVRIKKNSSNGRGAGIRFWSSHAEFEWVRIHDNYIKGIASNLHGGGIYSYNSDLHFREEARCNIYSNTSGSHNGYDIYCDNLVTVYLDTFTVLQPIELYASPISNFTFDILHTFSHGVIHVPTSTHPNIQSGIDTAHDGDTVLVQPGRYKENLDMKGKNIVLGSLYLLENDSVYIHSTIIDGDGKWCVINYNEQENLTCELNGFTLTYGIGVEHSWDNSRLGGAIYCQEASPTLRNLIITENQADLGSAIYCSRSSPIIENVTISKNTGSHGTIHCNTSGTPIISDVIINENHDYGLYIKTDPIISNTIITKNSRDGVFVEGSPKFYRVLIANNKYLGIASENSSLRLENTTVAYNGAGLSNVHSYTLIKNCIFWNNSEKEIELYQYMSGESRADIEYSNIKGGRHGITGWSGYQITINYDTTNINSDPLFCDPENGIYTLAENSPCIGKASDGENMGALEVGCYTDSQDVGNEYEQIPTILILYQNYPNPFNSSTKIKFALPKAETVKIEVYNIIGQKIETLLNKPMPTGYHEIEFNAKNLSSGIYLYRINAGEWQDVKKMILLR